MRPLFYLHYRLIVNSIKYTLRTPRRLIPTLVVVLWLVQSITFSIVWLIAPPYGVKISLGSMKLEQIWAVVFIGLTAAVIMITYSALRDGLLVFMPPHIDFLFPAPVSRRVVLVMKLLNDYGKHALYAAGGALVLLQVYVLLSKAPMTAATAWLGAVLLLVFVTNATHLLNIVTAYGAMRLRIAARFFKVALVLVAAGLIASAVTNFIWSGDVTVSLTRSVHNDVARFLLAPVVWCTNLVVGRMPNVAYRPVLDLLWLFLLAVGSFVVLIRRPENFYEPSLAVSARVARIRAAVQTGDWSTVRMERRRDTSGARSAGLWIPPFGRGAVALVWKYILVQYRRMGWSLLALFVLPPLTAYAVNSLIRDKNMLSHAPYGILFVVWGFIFAAQQDLRSELRQADVIKSMPIRGIKIVLAQTFGQWLQLAAFVGIAGLSIYKLIPEADKEALTLVLVGSLSLAMSCIAASGIAVLMYPDSRDRFQLMVPAFVGTIFVSMALIPSIAVLVVLLALHESILMLASALVVLNFILAWVALYIAGELFDRLDPTSS